MELHAFILSLLILSLVSTSEQRSLETVTCATTCTEPANVAFREGYSYEYLYSAAIHSTFDAHSSDSSNTNLAAQIAVDVLGPCEYVLRITSASLTSPDQTISSRSYSAWQESLLENPLHFSWQDGTIPNICAANDDPVWVLNIKRGILSTLQVSSLETVEKIEETDVSGTCESSYTVTENNGDFEIVKRKNYDTCEGREHHMLFSYFTPYSSESPRQNFVHSSQTCTQRLSESQVVETICNEKHTFRPFSNEDSGAQTIVEQRLAWNREVRYRSGPTLTAGNARRTDLVFEKEDEATVQSRDISEVRALFRDLCATMETENYDQVGKGFIKLVFLLRRLDASAIEQVESTLNGACPRREDAFKEMFEDALQWCGSEGCVVFTAKMIAAGSASVPDKTARSWLNGMNLITKPTMEMVKAVMKIVENGRLMDKSYLTAGTMIHRFCEDSSTNCMTMPAMRRILATFEEKLGTNCRTSTEEQKQEILLSLRALGNAGRTNSITTLADCAKEDANDMETRVAAIQTYRRMPCNTDRSALKTLLSNVGEDSEIRIASYLALMKCPTPDLIQQLVILLDEDENQQVVSFVWSHLNQVIESKDPLKGYMKALLIETAFAKTHDLDPRKYSKYYEASLFSEELNAGATLESSLIWSPKSFVPRSAEMGLTVDVFGQAVNLFEAGARVEGVEKMVQEMLASDGFMKYNPIGQLFMSEDDEEEPEEVEEDVRVSRSPDQTTLIEKREQYKRRNAKDLDQGEPNGNMYLRVFGNEMFYANARSWQTRKENFDAQSVIAQLLQGGRYNYHDDTMLMNSIHILPTGVGLPLTIAFNGSASVDVNIDGSLDMTGLFQASPNLEIRGSMEPRAVIGISGTMSVDFHVTKSGIATESTAITSWKMGGTASIANGKRLSVNIDSPYQRNTLFNFKHAVLKINGEETEEFGSTQANIVTDCTNEIVGQRLCLSRPRNLDIYPMSGPIEMSAYMDKTDRTFTQYVLNGNYEAETETGKYLPTTFTLNVGMDTPGSTVNRETRLAFSYDMNEMRFDFTLDHPQNQISMNGEVETDPTSRQLSIDFNKNGQQTRFEVLSKRVVMNGVTTWTTSTSLEMPSKTISGHATATLDPSQSISTSLQIQNLFDTPMVVNVTLEDKSDTSSQRMWYYGDGRIKIPGFIDTGGNFNLKFQPRSDNFKFRLSYQFGQMNQNDIVFNHKRRDQSTGTMTKWSAEQKLSITQFPLFNHFINLSYKQTEQSLDSVVKFEYGQLAGRQGNIKYISMNETLSFFSNRSGKGIEASAIIDIPPANVIYTGSLNHMTDDSTIDTNLAVGDYTMHLFLQDNTPRGGLINRAARLETPTPWGVLIVNNSMIETEENVYSWKSKFSLGSATGLSLNTTCILKNLATEKSVSLVVDGGRRNFLTASSFVSNEKNLFRFENSLTSIYNNLVEFNLNNDRTIPGGFKSTLFFQHEPSKYFRAELSKTSDALNTLRSATVEFKTPQGMKHSMELRENWVTSSKGNNVTIEFKTDLPNLTLRSFSASGQMMEISQGNEIGAWVRKDGLEYIGFDGSYGFTEERYGFNAEGNVNVRQVFTRTMNNLALSGNMRKENEEKTISASVSNSGNQLVSAALTLTDHSRLRGTLDHALQLPIPTPLRMDIANEQNEIRATISYSRKRDDYQQTIRFEKPRQNRATFYLTNNDPSLIIVPNNVEATLESGIRSSDNGKGLWLVSSVNNSPLNAEIMLFPNEMSLKFNHRVNGLTVPTFSVTASMKNDPKRLTAVLEVADTPRVSADITLSENNIAFGWMHSVGYLDLCTIPRHLTLNLDKTERGASMEIVGDLIVDNKNMHISFENSPSTLADIRYTSTLAPMDGSFGVKISGLSGTSGYKLVITHGAKTLKTSIFYELNSSLEMKMTQDIFEDFIPSLPRKTSISLTMTQNSMALSMRYNDNSAEITGTNSWARSSATGPLELQFAFHGNSFSDLNIPQEGLVSFEINDHSVLTTTVRADWGRNNDFQVSGSVDLAKRSVAFQMTHHLEALEDIGISETVNFEASLNLALESDSQNIGINGTLTINKKDYTVYFRRAMQMNEMPFQLSFTFGHNLEMVYEYGVPFEITSNTEIRQTTLKQKLSTTFATELIRVYRDADPVKNFVSVTADISLFQMHVSLSLAHNLPIPNVPKFLNFEVSASMTGDVSSSMMFNTVTVGLTRDDIKEIALYTVNLNTMQKERESLDFIFNHNATKLYSWGVPKTLQINFERRSRYVADLEVIYDTEKKSVGFAFDYHSRDSKLTAEVNHNFDCIKEKGLPKKIGAEISLPIRDRDADLEVKTTWGVRINVAHFSAYWDLDELTFRYNHHQNYTKTNWFFPARLRIKQQIDTKNYGFNTRVTISKRSFVEIDLQRASPFKLVLQQTLSPDHPRQVDVVEKRTGDSIKFTLSSDGAQQWYVIVTPTFDIDAWTGSLSIENWQGIDDTMYLPEHFELFANASYGEESSSFLRVRMTDKPEFMLGFRFGFDLMNKQGHAELIHGQDTWAEVLSKRVRVEVQYRASNSVPAMHYVTINTIRGEISNRITATGSYAMPTGLTAYSNVQLVHDIAEIADKIPQDNTYSFMYEIMPKSFIVQANNTNEMTSRVHSINANYNFLNNEFSTSLDIVCENKFLNEKYEIPQRLGGLVSAAWEDDISASVRTTFGETYFNVHLTTDKESRAEFEVTQSWTSDYQAVVLALSRQQLNEIRMILTIDGKQQEVILSGNWDANSGSVEFQHPFEIENVPKRVVVEGSYRLSPDYFMSVDATLDGKRHHVEGGFNKLENGFHVTSTLLDSVPRSATLRRSLIPGGFSAEIDHNIPELLDYLPGSAAVSASVKKQPRLNVTISLRRQDETERFSTEVDTERLQFTSKHDFKRLPLPRSISINLRQSQSPLTYELCVRINEVERTVRAIFDTSKKMIELFHSVPELDQWFSARNIAVGFKQTGMGGEIYLSVDGVIRRAGGSLDLVKKTLNLFQNSPETQEYPRNITFKIEGTLVPLNGKILLTMDETERSVAANVQPQGLFATIAVGIPETEEYIPRHMSIAGDFNGSSAQIMLSFFKNNRNQSISAGVMMVSNILAVSFMHDLDCCANIPSPINFHARVEFPETFSLDLTLGEKNYEITGELILNSQKWYGLHLSVRYFDHELAAIGITNPVDIFVKGRKRGNNYRLETNIDLIDEHSYSSSASITPVFKKKITSLDAEYSHTYNGRERRVTGSAAWSNTKSGRSLAITGEQTMPEKRQISFESSLKANFDDQYELVYSMSASHNISELPANIPREISINRATLTLDPEQLMVQWEGEITIQHNSSSSSGELSLHTDPERMGITGNAIIQSPSFSKSFNLDALYTSEMERNELFYGLIQTNRNTGITEREDRIVLATSSSSPMAEVQVNQAELNRYGVPRSMNVSFDSSDLAGPNINKHWVFNFTIDDMPFTWTIDFVVQDGPHVNIGSSLDSSVTFLEDMDFPSHMLSYFTLDVTQTDTYFSNTTIRSEYEDRSFMLNAIMERNSTSGNAMRHIVVQNMPKLETFFGASDYREEYSYTVTYPKLHAEGHSTVDGAKASDYTFDMNLKTKKFTYVSDYNNDGYTVDFDLQNTEQLQGLLFKISRKSKVILNIDVEYHPQLVRVSRFDFENHYGYDFDIKFSGSKDAQEISANAVTIFGNETGNCTITVQIEPNTNGMIGHQFSWSRTSGSDRVKVEATYEFANQHKVGRFQYVLTGNDDPLAVTLSYSPAKADFLIRRGRQRVKVRLDNASNGDSINLSGSLKHKNIDMLEIVPENIDFSFSMSDNVFDVTANGLKVIDFQKTQTGYTLQVKHTDGEYILNCEVSYSLGAKKQFDITCMSSVFSFNWSAGASMIFFSKATGNSSLIAHLVNNADGDRFDFNAFALPDSTYDPEDFSGRLTSSSTFQMLPFDFELKCRSDNQRASSRYVGEYEARYNDKVFSVNIDFKPYDFTLEIAQPWVQETPVITIQLQKETNEEGFIVGKANFSWSENSVDKLNFLGKLKSAGNIFHYSVEMEQPSGLFYVQKCGVKADGDFSRSDIAFGINSYLNEYEMGFNASYAGDLPQLMGVHYLEVDITQPIFFTIPSKFKTIGDIELTSSSYSSKWSIRDDQDTYVTLNKHFNKNRNGVTTNLYWKQALFNVPYHFINISANGRADTGEITLQVDDMPQISGSYNLAEDEENNRTLRVNFNSGPLPLCFRTLSLTSWYKQEEGRQTGPKLSINLDIDNHPYHLYIESVNVGSSGASRSNFVLKIAYPWELDFFGTALPNELDLKFSTLMKRKGMKVIFNYNDNLMDKPLKSSADYRWNNGNNLFEATADVEKEALYKIKFTVASDSATISVKCPEENINVEAVLTGQNAANIFEIGASMKNYTASPRMNWETSLTYDKSQRTVEIVIDTPEIERMVLRGDLSEVIQQMKTMFKRLASEASNSRVHFIKGMSRTTTGYDLYIGYEVDGDASYTMHLLLGAEEDGTDFAALQLHKNSVLQTEVARVTVKLIEGSLVKVHLSANPALLNFVRKTIKDLDTESSRKINMLADTIVEGLESLKTVVIGDLALEANVNRRVDAMIAKVNYYRDEAIRMITTLASDSNEKFSAASMVTEDGVRNALRALLGLVDAGKNLVLQPFTKVCDQYFGAMLNETNEVLVETLRPVITLLRKINAGNLLIDLIEEATQKTFDHMMTNGEAFFRSARTPLADLLYVDESNFIINIPLAVDVDGLKPMPSLEDIKTWLARSTLAMTVNDAMEKLYSYVDEYYKARALVYMPRDEMLPPFKGHAFVSGFKHFSTFDKRQYSFQSGCDTSHVLAADMRNNNFTVAITYADPSDRSAHNALEVLVENKRVTVYDDYKVKLNGRTKDLPIDLDVMSVMLQGNAIHVRRKDGDLDVVCDFTKELCTIDVSPYYFGATAGMAGVYNNEPMDDFKAPRRTVATDTELATEWESTGKYCTNMNAFEPCASNRVPERCNALFKEPESTLRPCFPLVDPQPFLEMCQNDLCDSSNNKKACSAVHAYAYRCSLMGAKMKLPEECVECESVSQSNYDASASSENTVSTMDLVLVVEQGSCMSRKGIASSMRRFFKKLGSTLSDNRMRDVNYHLVGYGGPGASAMPNTLTIRNKKFTTNRNHMLKALKKISLSSQQTYADTLGAISYASQLSFRAGAKPVIVLLSCDSCHDSEVSYSDVERQIRKQGILLHHMPQQSIVAGSKSMYGFDAINAYSRGSDVSESVIKRNKEDMCEPLATATGGSVWDGATLMRNDAAFHTKFIEYIVRQAGKGQAQTCRCEMNESGVPTSVCS